MVRYLLQKGADPAAEDAVGRSCVWAAREGGEKAVVELLEQAVRERQQRWFWLEHFAQGRVELSLTVFVGLWRLAHMFPVEGIAIFGDGYF